jgi:hypothetical protein
LYFDHSKKEFTQEGCSIQLKSRINNDRTGYYDTIRELENLHYYQKIKVNIWEIGSPERYYSSNPW